MNHAKSPFQECQVGVGDRPLRLTTIGYCPVLHHPITECKTVRKCLQFAEEATHEVGQEYVITTSDLEVCMKPYLLKLMFQAHTTHRHIPFNMCIFQHDRKENEFIWPN